MTTQEDTDLEVSLDDWVERAKAEHARAFELMKADPKLGITSAITIAGDMGSAERAWAEMEAGMPFGRALWFVGSFSRMDFALRAIAAGFATKDEVIALLPGLWRGSDPDDTDPRFLALWKEALAASGEKYIRDMQALPRRSILTVYRGQDEGVTVGIAWTLSEDIAGRFAMGSGTRQSHRGGVVYVAQVRRKDVIAYLTRRGEFEIVVDPADLITAENSPGWPLDTAPKTHVLARG